MRIPRIAWIVAGAGAVIFLAAKIFKGNASLDGKLPGYDRTPKIIGNNRNENRPDLQLLSRPLLAPLCGPGLNADFNDARQSWEVFDAESTTLQITLAGRDCSAWTVQLDGNWITWQRLGGPLSRKPRRQRRGGTGTTPPRDPWTPNPGM
jgi:hypothetical protein